MISSLVNLAASSWISCCSVVSSTDKMYSFSTHTHTHLYSHMRVNITAKDMVSEIFLGRIHKELDHNKESLWLPMPRGKLHLNTCTHRIQLQKLWVWYGVAVRTDRRQRVSVKGYYTVYLS